MTPLLAFNTIEIKPQKQVKTERSEAHHLMAANIKASLRMEFSPWEKSWNFKIGISNPGISKLKHIIEMPVLSLLTSTQDSDHTCFWPNFVSKVILFHKETKIFPSLKNHVPIY